MSERKKINFDGKKLNLEEISVGDILIRNRDSMIIINELVIEKKDNRVVIICRGSSFPVIYREYDISSNGDVSLRDAHARENKTYLKQLEEAQL